MSDSVNNDFVVACKVSVLLLSALKSGKCVMMFVILSNVSLLESLNEISHFGNSSTHVTFSNDEQLINEFVKPVALRTSTISIVCSSLHLYAKKLKLLQFGISR